MPEGSKSRVSGVGVESNRPATNFPGISVDSNRFNRLVEKSGFRCRDSAIIKPHQTRRIPVCEGVAQWLGRFVRDEEACGSSSLTPTIVLRYIVNADGDRLHIAPGGQLGREAAYERGEARAIRVLNAIIPPTVSVPWSGRNRFFLESPIP